MTRLARHPNDSMGKEMYSKVDQLEGIYASIETGAARFKSAAACAKGCAFCCTDAGRILHMLEVPGFRDTYMAGDFKPEEIADFGKTHQLIINRMVCAEGRSRE
jgi:hypothetical protein